MMTCEEVRLSLGAHALGALEPDEALEIDTHLATCEECGAELMELSGVTAFLAKVSEREVEQVVRPPHQVLDRLLSARARRRRRARLMLAVAASAAAVVVGGTVWNGAQQGGAPAESASSVMAPEVAHDKAAERLLADTPAPAKAKQDQSMAAAEGMVFKGKRGSVKASVTAMPGRPATTVTVTVQGVPVGTKCSLVVVGRDGTKETATTWTARSGNYSEDGAWEGTTSIAADQIARFDIVDAHGRTLLTAKPG